MMMNKYSRLDIALLVFLFLLTVWIFYYNISGDGIININDLLMVLLIIFFIRLLVYNSVFGQYWLFFFLVFAVAGIVKIKYTLGDTTYSSNSTFNAGSLSFDPLSFLLLLLFLGINRKSIFQLIYGSDQERDRKRAELKEFYYEKFKKSSDVELNAALEVLNDYPIEAQYALKKIQQERATLNL